MGIFPYMEPFVTGDKKLKQPFRSSLCACTCVDIAVSSAIMKLTGRDPKITDAPLLCWFDVELSKAAPMSYDILCERLRDQKKADEAAAAKTNPIVRQPKRMIEAAATKKYKPDSNPLVECVSKVYMLEGGINEERRNRNQFLIPFDLRQLKELFKGVSEKAFKKIGIDNLKIVFEPEVWHGFKDNPELIMKYINGEEAGKKSTKEPVKLNPGEGAVCFVEFGIPGTEQSHACIVCGMDETEQCFYIYNPEIAKPFSVKKIEEFAKYTHGEKGLTEEPTKYPASELKVGGDSSYSTKLIHNYKYKFSSLSVFKFHLEPVPIKPPKPQKPSPSVPSRRRASVARPIKTPAKPTIAQPHIIKPE